MRQIFNVAKWIWTQPPIMYPISPRVIDQQCTLKIGRIKTQRWAQKETKDIYMEMYWLLKVRNKMNFFVLSNLAKEQFIYSSPRASS